MQLKAEGRVFVNVYQEAMCFLDADKNPCLHSFPSSWGIWVVTVGQLLKGFES